MNPRRPEVHILARMHGVNGHRLMPVIRRSDQDGVHVLAGQDLAIIPRGEEVRSPHLLAVGQSPVIAVGNGDQLHTRTLQRVARVALALDAGADQRKLNRIVRRARRGSG